MLFRTLTTTFKAILLIGTCMLLRAFPAHGQKLFTAKEDFDSQISHTPSPPSLWDTCSRLHTTAPCAMRGLLPQQAGDSSTLSSPVYDLSPYSHVYLVFDHICKISKEDMACIEIKEDFLGARWHSISSSCYRGKDDAYRQQRFSDNSYALWQNEHAEALPDNRWWKTECFDLSGEAAYAKIQLRFKIRKGSGNSGRFAYGWLLDNIRIYAGNQELPIPVLQLCEPVCAGEMYETGPFRIAFRNEGGAAAKISAEYTVNDKTHAAEILQDSDRFAFSIPQTPYGQVFTYTLHATDSAGLQHSVQRFFCNPMPSDGRDSNAAGIAGLLSPQRHIARTGEQIPLRIQLKNTGMHDLRQARVCWSYNGSTQSADWSGMLPADFCSDSLTLGHIRVCEKDDSLKLWIASANGRKQKNADTLRFFLNACTDFLHGTYRIGGKDADFADIESALRQVEHCGLSGTTTFAFDSGSYALHLDLKQLNLGMDSLIFTSFSGNAADVTWTADSTYPEIVRMENVSRICFRKLSFRLDSLHPKALSACVLNDSCRQILVEGCHFQLLLPDAQGVSSTDRNACREIALLGNRFSEGRFGVLIWGNTTHDYRAFRAEQNIFDRQTYAGLYLMATDFSHIRGNTFLSSRTPTLGNRNYTGMELYGCYGKTVEQNRFRLYSGKYAMDLGIVLPDSSAHVDFVNNEIYFQCTHAQSAGIMLGSSCRKLRFLHNSILMDGKTNGNCCVSVSGISDSIQWEKNLWAHYGARNTSPRIWKFTQPVYPYLSGHFFYGNHYAVPEGGFLQTDQLLEHLEEWQKLHAQDADATEGNIRFADTSQDLSLAEAFPLCFSSPEITTDNIQQPRKETLSTKGAYHCIGKQQDDAAVLALLSPEGQPAPGDSLPLRIVIANAGTRPLRKVQIAWTWNGRQQRCGISLPDLKCGDTLHTSILSWLHPQNGDNLLKIRTSLPNDSSDACSANDSLQRSFYACDSALCGDYLVGADKADFPDLESAVRKALNCGVRGPVRFLLLPGKYPCALNIEGKIPGSSPAKNLTVRSLSGEADSVELYRDSFSTGQRAALRLAHTAHWSFEHLCISGCRTGQTPYSIAVEILDSCSDLRIQHCTLNARPPGQGASLCCGIYSAETTADSIFLENNRLNGGMYGIYLHGYSVNKLLKNIRITHNRFSNHEESSLFLRWATFQELSHNRAESFCLQAVSGQYIRANRLHNTTHSHCLQLTETGPIGQGGTLQIHNNECISNAYNPHCGMEIGPYCHDIHCLHNSFSVIGKAEGKCLQLQDDPTLWNIHFRNNLFYQGCSGFDTACLSWSEIRSPSAYTFSGNAYGKQSFADSASCLQLKSAGKAYCLRLAEASEDICGQSRTKLTCKGAYTLPSCGTDVCLIDLVSPSEKVASGSIQAVRVRIGNLGDSAVSRLCLHWESDGLRQNDVHWRGSLEKGDTAVVYLGDIQALRSCALRIYVEQLDKDSCAENDTLFRRLTVCEQGLCGEVRVGRDFPDLESAIEALYHCGIRENVRLVLPAGRYYGPFDFDRRIPGSDSLHRITLAAEVADSCILTLNNQLQTEQAILRCGHCAHWIFENLRFHIPEKQQEACAIQLLYDCEDLCVRHCSFELQEHSQAAVLQLSNWGTAGFSFLHNRVYGGRYGLRLCATASQPNHKLSLCDNLFTETILSGISLENSHFTEISRNSIRQKKSCSTGFYGIRLQSVSGERMDANRIWASRGFYGLYLDRTAGKEQTLLISNNEIHLNVPSSNCGIYLYDGCDRIAFCHNSILLEGSGMGKCLYTAFNLYNISLQNNQFANFSGKSGSNDNPVLYFYSTNGFAGWKADYNHYYSMGQTLITAGGNCPDIRSWQLKTGKEAHSNSFRPSYMKKDSSLKLSNYDSLDCPLLPQVPTDKNGMERMQPTQRGCHQAISTQAVDWELSALESPQTGGACPEAFQSLRVRVRNAGRDTLFLDRHPLCLRIIMEGPVRMEERYCLRQGTLAPLHSGIFTLKEQLVLEHSGNYTLSLIVEDTADSYAANDSLHTAFSIKRTALPFCSNMDDAQSRMQFRQISGKAQWFSDTSASEPRALSGKTKLCFPSGGARGSIAQADLGYLDLSGLRHPVLSVWYARNDRNKSETDLLRLLVSAEGDSLQEVRVLYRYKANCSQSVWERADIDLGAYAGKCVRMVWEGISYGGGNQYIDSMQLQGRPFLQASLLFLPGAVRDCRPDARGLSVRVCNPSLQPVTADSALLCLDMLSPGKFSYRQKNALTLSAYACDTLLVDADFPWECGNLYRFSFGLESGGEQLSDTMHTEVSTLADVGILQLQRPVCCKPGKEISVSARLCNSGSLDVYGIPVEILINDSLVAQDSIPLIRRDEELQYSYPGKLYAPLVRDSIYALEIRLPLECDGDFSNNSCYLRACLQQEADSTGTVQAMTEENELHIAPNPSRGESFLLLRLQAADDIQWEIISTEGQVLYRAKTEAQAGENRIRLPGLQQHKGMVFVRVQYGKYRRIIKWIRL